MSHFLIRKSLFLVFNQVIVTSLSPPYSCRAQDEFPKKWETWSFGAWGFRGAWGFCFALNIVKFSLYDRETAEVGVLIEYICTHEEGQEVKLFA